MLSATPSDAELTQFGQAIAADFAAGRDGLSARTDVGAIIDRALDAKRPKPRYYITTPTHLMGLARRLLTTPALDWLIAKG